MPNEVKEIEIIEYKPTHIKLRFLPFGKIVKMSKRFFKNRIDNGFYEVVNKEKIPSVI